MKDKKPQKKLSPVTIRLTDEQHQGLSDICATTGADNAFLVRVAVSGLLDYVAANGGHLHLPLDFTTAWAELHDLLNKLEHQPVRKTIDASAGEQIHRPSGVTSAPASENGSGQKAG